MKDKILIVGAGTFQLPLVERASLDHEVLVAAPVIDDRFSPYISGKLICDVRDKEKVLEYAESSDIKGVITDQTDIAVRTVAYVAEKMGLPGIGYETGCLFTDKSLMRSRMSELGIKLLPNKTVTSLDEALEFYDTIHGSVIIKPLDTQGSRGVSRCDSAGELKAKYGEASRWSSNGKVIVEKYATGREFVVEGMAADYEFRNLNIGDTEYFDLPDAFAAKTRIFPSTCSPALKQRVYDLNREIVTGFGLKQGITHSEFIMDGDDIYLIETAARGGGVFISSDLIHICTGLDTEAFLIGLATGEITSLPDAQEDLEACGYMAFYVPEGTVTEIKGLDEVRQLPFVHRNQLDELYVGKKTDTGHSDKTSRIALTVSGKTRDEVMQRMDQIRFTLEVACSGPDGVKGLIWE